MSAKNVDLLRQYCQEIRQFNLMTKERERECFEARDEARELGDDKEVERIETEIFLANLPFVVHIAGEFKQYNISRTEFVSEGNEGLRASIKNFDINRGYKFITYAVWKIRNMMHRFADQYVSDISLISLNEPLSNSDRDGRTLTDVLADKNAISPDECVINKSLRDAIEIMLGQIPYREAIVIRLYFGIGYGRTHTLNEIGGILGLTRERVRQLKGIGIRRIQRLRGNDVVDDMRKLWL